MYEVLVGGRGGAIFFLRAQIRGNDSQTDSLSSIRTCLFATAHTNDYIFEFPLPRRKEHEIILYRVYIQVGSVYTICIHSHTDVFHFRKKKKNVQTIVPIYRQRRRSTGVLVLFSMAFEIKNAPRTRLHCRTFFLFSNNAVAARSEMYASRFRFPARITCFIILYSIESMHIRDVVQ